MASPIPEDPNALLWRRATAEALTAAGYQTAEKTLATKASRGGGPPYRLWGKSRSTAGATLWRGRRAGFPRRLAARRNRTLDVDGRYRVGLRAA